MKKIVLFTGGLDVTALLLSDLAKNPKDTYTFLFIENNVDGEGYRYAQSVYREVKKLFPKQTNLLIFEKICFLPKSYKPKEYLWLNLYASAIRIASEYDAKAILSGALFGDGQDEVRFHSRFIKFAKSHYGINIIAPYATKRYSEGAKIKVLNNFIKLTKNDTKHDYSKLIKALGSRRNTDDGVYEKLLNNSNYLQK